VWGFGRAGIAPAKGEIDGKNSLGHLADPRRRRTRRSRDRGRERRRGPKDLRIRIDDSALDWREGDHIGDAEVVEVLPVAAFPNGDSLPLTELE